MVEAQFGDSFLPELREIMESVSTDAISGLVANFTAPWALENIGYEHGSARRRLVCKLSAKGRSLVAILDAADFDARMRGNTTRTRPWNSAESYHDMAVSASTLLQEYVLMHDPDDPELPDGAEIRLQLPRSTWA
jgi:hypothetical protein